MLDNVKKDFPIFDRRISDKPLIYLDSAATSQKPNAVINSIVDYYKNHNANVHRGIHTLSEEATEMYEDARSKIADFIKGEHDEIVFTKGATESLNRIAFTFAAKKLKEGDTVLISEAEHHSNLVPWQIVCRNTKANLKYLEVDENGEITLSEIKKKITNDVKFIAITHASNVLGTIFPIKEICRLAKEVGAYVVVDGSQAVVHMPIDVKSLGCDFYAFSAHKMLGPTGVGVLWGKKELLEKMDPYEYGGGMIIDVKKDISTFAKVPERLEAGTPNIAGVIAFGAAIDYLNNLGMTNVREHDVMILDYAIKELLKIKGLTILGTKDAEKRTGLVSFTLDNAHPHDVAAVLNSEGIAVRAGHHCAKVLHTKFNIIASTRASFYIYNDKSDIDALVYGIKKVISLFK